MAYDPGSLHLHADQERVAVAVGTDGNDSQSISRALALRPEFVARAAEECDVADIQRALKRFLVHKAEHQDFVRFGILDDRGHQSLHFVEVDLWFHSVSSRSKTKSPLTLSRQRAGIR